MRFPRPKSLSGLMLIGFTIVAAPLLFAIVNAAVQMNHLSSRSEDLVLHGVRGTRNNQRMFEEIGALERTARLYQIIGSKDLLDVESRDGARALENEAERLHEELKHDAPNSARMAELINAFPQLSEMASKVSNRVSAQIDRELTSLQLATQLAQRNLFWETLLLVPLTMAVVGVFTYLCGRPIRAIDRAISELGRGTFSRPLMVTFKVVLRNKMSPTNRMILRVIRSRAERSDVSCRGVADDLS